MRIAGRARQAYSAAAAAAAMTRASQRDGSERTMEWSRAAAESKVRKIGCRRLIGHRSSWPVEAGILSTGPLQLPSSFNDLFARNKTLESENGQLPKLVALV